MEREAGFGTFSWDDNPNLADAPTPRTDDRTQDGAQSEPSGNVWWSDWANTEQRLEMMRLEGLPMPAEFGEDALGREAAEAPSAGMSGTAMEFRSTSDGRSTSGFGDWSDRPDPDAAAVELDRQTSVGGYIPERAMGFLRESEDFLREPQYYNIHSGRNTPDNERGSGSASSHGPTSTRWQLGLQSRLDGGQMKPYCRKSRLHLYKD